MNKLNWCILIIFGIIFSTWLIYTFTMPKEAKDSADPISTRSEYLKELYKGITTREVSPTRSPPRTPNPNLDNLVQDNNIDWLWDTAPTVMLEKHPIAKNLSFSWPPTKGSRYRLTAFPYPNTGESSFWLVKFAEGMASLLDNTSGQITFPGWQISIYDPLEPNYNSWQSFLPSNDDTGISDEAIYVEVTHACYAPPQRTYPTCDDGGYWLYGAVGSGVFWKTCGTTSSETGKFLVCNNKIDAIFKLWRYAQKSLGGIDLYETLAPSMIAAKMISPGLTPYESNLETIKKSKPEDYIYARLNGTGGGDNLMEALKNLIDASDSGKQIPNLTAWRSMEPSTSNSGWVLWIACSITFTLILLGGIIYSVYSASKGSVQKFLLGIVCTLIAARILYYFEWSVVSENMFRKFGYTTMDSALEKSGLNLKDFIFSTAGIDTNYKKLPKGKYNPISNGLAQTQLFDFDLSYITSMCKLDSVIMHTQPNKSGSWAVEILDVRNTPAQGATSLDDLIKTLGLCGQPVTTSPHPTLNSEDVKPMMPPLKQGPLSVTTNYFGYQPDALCNCDESEVQKQHSKGILKKCVFCKDSLSEKLC